MTDEEIEGLLVQDIREFSAPMLSVMVDFNDLFADHGDTAFEMIAKLKDLLS